MAKEGQLTNLPICSTDEAGAEASGSTPFCKISGSLKDEFKEARKSTARRIRRGKIRGSAFARLKSVSAGDNTPCSPRNQHEVCSAKEAPRLADQLPG